MNAHIRLVSSETVAEDANNHDAHENAGGGDEAPIGLPEEGGSTRNDILGEAPPPLVAEPEDRAGGARNARGSKKGVSKLIALVWPPKAKTPAPVAGEEDDGEGEGEGERRASGRRRRRPALRRRRKALAARRKRQRRRPSRGAIVLSLTTVRLATAPQVAAAAKARPPVLKRKGALAAALAASVAIPAIVVLNWPHSAPQPVVEPGMLADGQTKVMAPSAALATAPPREAPNVSRDRPLVNETRRDELTEMLSFKGGDKAADGATPKPTRGRSDAENRRAGGGSGWNHRSKPEGGTAVGDSGACGSAAGRGPGASRRPAPRQHIRPPREARFLQPPPKRSRQRRSSRRRRVTLRKPPCPFHRGLPRHRASRHWRMTRASAAFAR